MEFCLPRTAEKPPVETRRVPTADFQNNRRVESDSSAGSRNCLDSFAAAMFERKPPFQSSSSCSLCSGFWMINSNNWSHIDGTSALPPPLFSHVYASNRRPSRVTIMI